MALEILRLLLFILPAWFANSSPVVLGGGTPMDFRWNWTDGRRILGDGKTWRGFFGGIVVGTAAAALEAFSMGSYIAESFILVGLLLSIGTLVGDAVGSFVKRRMGTPPGRPSFVMDQLFFFVFALLFAAPVLPPYIDATAVAFLAVLTLLAHMVSNWIANRLGLKKVPW